MAFVLTPDTAVEVLRDAGLIGGDERVAVRTLGGGVSSNVVRADVDGRGFVLKQPLPRFRVAQEWLVDVARSRVEARFASRFHDRLGPLRCASLVFEDYQSNVLVFEAAPDGFHPWKEDLLAGRADPRLGDVVGTGLAALHERGRRPDAREGFEQPGLFDQQRIDPYLRSTRDRHPALGGPFDELIAHLERDRTTVVHGDFSPKNMLTNGRELLLVDHEVATLNDPEFDRAFFLTHLLLKRVHVERAAADLRATALRFLDAYARVARDADSRPSSRLLGAILLARVDGKSPVEYLGVDEQQRVRTQAIRVLKEPKTTLRAVVESWRP